MPGFFGVINVDASRSNPSLPDIGFEDSMSSLAGNATYSLFRNTHNKFSADKIFFNGDELMIVLEGVIFNRSALQATSKVSWEETVGGLYKKYGIGFPRRLEGSFFRCDHR